MEDTERPAKIRKLSHDFGSTGNIQDDATTKPHSHFESGAPDEQNHLALQERNSDVDDGEEKQSQVMLMPEEIAPISSEIDQAAPPISKNQLKKLRRKAEWEAGRAERKLIRKEKLVAKRERKQALKQEEAANGIQPSVTPSKSPNFRAVQLPITFVIDCDYDDLMRDGERVSLASQLTRCYSDNKNARYRAHLTISSFGGKLRERFDTVLAKNYQSWRGVRALDCNFVETAEKAKEWMVGEQGGKLAGHFAKYASLDPDSLAKLKEEGEVVYLSSEGDYDLTDLKPYSTYIVGGLVDKNRERGLCFKRAKAAGVKTARLPIGQYMAMQSRKVLATNHVNEIMVHWLENGDWAAAFLKAIPKRKGGTLRTSFPLREQQNSPDEQVEEIDEAADTDHETAVNINKVAG